MEKEMRFSIAFTLVSCGYLLASSYAFAQDSSRLQDTMEIKRGFIDPRLQKCINQTFPADMNPLRRSEIVSDCYYGWLEVHNITPHIGTWLGELYFSVEVKTGSRVAEETIALSVHVGSDTTLMQRKGSTTWQAPLTVSKDTICEESIEAVFKAEWNTTPSAISGYWISHTAEFQAEVKNGQKQERPIVPRPSQNEGIVWLTDLSIGAPTSDYVYEGSVGFDNFAREDISVNGIDLYCADPGETWRECRDDDYAKISQSSINLLNFPSLLECGKSIRIDILFKEREHPALLLLRTDQEDIAIEVGAKEKRPK